MLRTYSRHNGYADEVTPALADLQNPSVPLTFVLTRIQGDGSGKALERVFWQAIRN